MIHSLQSLAVTACCLLLLTLCPAVARSDTPKETTAQAPARDEVLTKELDELVMTAAKKAKPWLQETVNRAEHALRYAPADHAKQYRVLEHKGWWVVAWYGRGTRPELWMSGFAIRKYSRDIYHFGGW